VFYETLPPGIVVAQLRQGAFGGLIAQRLVDFGSDY
jgi:hypothetical protein